MKYTRDELEAADRRRARLVAAVDRLALEQAAGKRAAAAQGLPLEPQGNDGLQLLLAMVNLWGDEPGADERRGRSL